jgi:HNH endonuclease
MTGPFIYPSAPHVRRHGPRGYADAASYRPWLRDEFCFRCVYCLLRESWGLARGMFGIDHFLPTSLHPKKAGQYDNLVYACTTCNLAKGKRTLPDPCLALVQSGIQVLEDGTLVTHTKEARRLVRVLGLDSAEYVEFRRLWIDIIALIRVHDGTLHQRLMGFPENLPQLQRLRPPRGNTRPEGIGQSWLARKERGELPELY